MHYSMDLVSFAKSSNVSGLPDAEYWLNDANTVCVNFARRYIAARNVAELLICSVSFS